MEKPEKIIFQTAKYDDLVKIVKLKMSENKTLFREWFHFKYELTKADLHFLKKLIKTHKEILSSYSEEDLKMYFISNILNRINFILSDRRGFFDKPLKARINEVEFSGKTDFMVASGIEEPQKPYFFIQEFKREEKATHPKNQLLAELLAAIELNKTNLIRGAYILGRYWHFMILEKMAENSYQYFISNSFDSLDFEKLKQIYVCLQAVKLVYCND